MKWMNHIGMRKKLMLSYIVIAIVPICIIGYFLTSALYKSSFSNVSNLSAATFKQMEGNYINKFSVYSDILDTIINDSAINRYIDTNYNQDYEAFNDYLTSIAPLIDRATYNDKRAKIRIYSANNTIGFSRVTNNTIRDLEHEKWFKRPLDSISGVRWAFSDQSESEDHKDYVVCYRIWMDNYKQNKIKAVVAVFFNENQLYSLASEEQKAGKMVFIYDDQNKIITSTERNLLFRSVDHPELKEINSAAKLNSGSLLDYKEQKYIVFTSVINQNNININNWHMIYMVPANKTLADINKIWMTSLALCVICIIFTMIVIVWLSHNITGRISRLIKKMNRIWNGDFKVPKHVSGNDEIGVLETDFYRMVDKIDTLINEVYQAEINYQKIQMEKKESELIALRQQINPHYLFNTLETIRMKLVKKNDRETANIIMVFAESFRACLESRDDLYTLEQELDLVRNYFIIQKYSYGEKVQLEIEVPEYLRSFYIPKLMLQPLVENAVYHGIETKLGSGLVLIEGYLEGDRLFLRVSDNGIGIPADQLDKIKGVIYGNLPVETDGQSGGLALKNVHNRLSLQYGNGYGLEIASVVNKGTSVEINMPNQGWAAHVQSVGR